VRSYYSESLSGERLRRCYELAPPRIRRYLEAEIEFVLDRVGQGDRVLELGCGYGRVIERLISRASTVVGIDNSLESLRLARKMLGERSSVQLVCSDAGALALRDASLDLVICVQNGISALSVERRRLIDEAVRVTRPGGRVMLSSYSDAIWPDRLEWFEIQSRHGLIGELDHEATGDGVIVCADGFKATTVRPAEFVELASRRGLDPTITEVDGSSVFCEFRVGEASRERSLPGTR
jgi:ubiquinone/menaquinone biosynthesis C-methylase UbiE